MLLLNFSHPLTEGQVAQTTELLGLDVQVHDVRVQIDFSRDLISQVREIVDQSELGFGPGRSWEITPFVVRPAALDAASVAIIAEIHGRCGYFPPILTMRREGSAMPPTFAVWEIVNLQSIRDTARTRRR